MRDWKAVGLAVLLHLPPVAGLLAWPFVAMMSVTLFDAAGSHVSLVVWLHVIAIWVYPLPVIAGTILTFKRWCSRNLEQYRYSILLSYAGVVSVFLTFLLWASVDA